MEFWDCSPGLAGGHCLLEHLWRQGIGASERAKGEMGRERAWRGAERSGVELRQAREEGARLAALWRCQLPFAAPARTLPGTHLQTRLIRGRVICLQCPDRVKHALCGKWNSTTCSPPFLSLKKREKKNGKHDHKALSIALVGLNGKRRTLDNVATRG